MKKWHDCQLGSLRLLFLPYATTGPHSVSYTHNTDPSVLVLAGDW